MRRLYKKVDKMRVNSKKEQFRSRAKKALKFEAKFGARCKHYAMLKTIFKIIEIYKPRRILLFIPLKYEPNLLLLRRDLARICEIFVPFMVDVSFKMVKLRCPFFVRKFGVKEPNAGNARRKIDLAIIPVIGVDGNFARIGHGKGYYDIFFSQFEKKPKIIFVEIKDMFINDIISENHDIKGDFYITPKKNYYLKGRNDRDFTVFRRRNFGRWHRISSRKKDK